MKVTEHLHLDRGSTDIELIASIKAQSLVGLAKENLGCIVRNRDIAIQIEEILHFIVVHTLPISQSFSLRPSGQKFLDACGRLSYFHELLVNFLPCSTNNFMRNENKRNCLIDLDTYKLVALQRTQLVEPLSEWLQGYPSERQAGQSKVGDRWPWVREDPTFEPQCDSTTQEIKDRRLERKNRK